MICNGGTGVSAFFVLSGFLITYLLIKEFEQLGKIDITNFYIRRVLRIWPLYYAVVIFSFIIYPFLKSRMNIISPNGANFYMHLAFLSNFDLINIEKYFPGNSAASQGITWSVSIEEQFYLIWPLLFKFVSKKFWSYLMLTVLIGSILFRIYYHNNNILLYFHTFSVLMDLAMGGLFAYAVLFKQRVREFFEKTNTGFHFTIFLITVFLLFFAPNFYKVNYGIAIYRIPVSLCFAFLVTSQAITKNKSIFNLSNFKFAITYGKYTYGIYLLHPIILMLLEIVLEFINLKKDSLLGSIIFTFISFLFTCQICKFVYYNFEHKFLKFKNKFSPELK